MFCGNLKADFVREKINRKQNKQRKCGNLKANFVREEIKKKKKKKIFLERK